MGKIVVFGSYVTDLTARCSGFPTEGQTVKGISFKDGPGGKGSNQAVAAHRVGGDVTFISKIGSDHYGKKMLEFYASEGMSSEGVIVSETEDTGCALIMVDENTKQNEIVVIPAACDHITPEEVESSIHFLDGADVMVTQLETNMDATVAMLKAAKEKGAVTVLNPAPAAPIGEEILRYADVVIPNETEASLITGIKMEADCSNAPVLAKKLMDMGAKKVIITLGSHGAYVTDGNSEKTVDAIHYEDHPVVDTTGAGDAFVGGFAAGIASGLDLFRAVEYGNCVSSIAVTRFGTAPAMPYKEEVEKVFLR